MPFALVYVTYASQSEAERITGILLAEKLAAGANLFPIQSAFWWKGAVQSENEWVSLLQTSDTNWPRLKERVAELHTYEVPCIIRLQAEANHPYEQWVESTSNEKSRT